MLRSGLMVSKILVDHSEPAGLVGRHPIMPCWMGMGIDARDEGRQRTDGESCQHGVAVPEHGKPGGEVGCWCRHLTASGCLTKAGEQPKPVVGLWHWLPDIWSVDLFCAPCRKHGVRPCRYRRQRRTAAMLRVQERESCREARPECRKLRAELAGDCNDVTDHLISHVTGSGGSSTLDLK